MRTAFSDRHTCRFPTYCNREYPDGFSTTRFWQDKRKRGLAIKLKVSIRVTVSASACDHNYVAVVVARKRVTGEKLYETRIEKQSNKKVEKEKCNINPEGKREDASIFFPRRKSSIICHLLGLKVSDRSLKGSDAGN